MKEKKKILDEQVFLKHFKNKIKKTTAKKIKKFQTKKLKPNASYLYNILIKMKITNYFLRMIFLFIYLFLVFFFNFILR